MRVPLHCIVYSPYEWSDCVNLFLLLLFCFAVNLSFAFVYVSRIAFGPYAQFGVGGVDEDDEEDRDDNKMNR